MVEEQWLLLPAVNIGVQDLNNNDIPPISANINHLRIFFVAKSFK